MFKAIALAFLLVVLPVQAQESDEHATRVVVLTLCGELIFVTYATNTGLLGAADKNALARIPQVAQEFQWAVQTLKDASEFHVFEMAPVIGRECTKA